MKNTSAAVTLSTLYLLKKDPNAVILIAPSDHLVDEKIQSFFSKNFNTFDKNFLYVFGIKPTEPNPSYGYIRKGNKIKNNFFKVEKFFEKPKISEAKQIFKNECPFIGTLVFFYSRQRLLLTK